MRLGQCTTILAILYSYAVLALPARTAEFPRPRANADLQETSQASVQRAYPESIEGLENQLRDLFAVIKAGDISNSSALQANLAIPNHEEWFLKTFGPTEGVRLEAKYKEVETPTSEYLRKRIEMGVKKGWTQINVETVERLEDTPLRLIRAALAAVQQPTKIYMVSDQAPDDQSANFVGDFVYVQGSFRYLDMQVVQALSTAPPLRITVGGNVQRARQTNRVEPAYPPDARSARLSGTVLLDVIIGVDGTVQQVQLISGHPMLVRSALDAVRQWRYQPTLLNGQPVEVETQVNVIFSLKP